MEHDKFCEYDGWMCQCAVIASARADERERAVSTVYAAGRWLAARGDARSHFVNQIAWGLDRGDTLDDSGNWTPAIRGEGE